MTTKQVLLQQYIEIEHERIQLKQVRMSLKGKKGDKNEIETIGRKLTILTFNQAHILIDLKWE